MSQPNTMAGNSRDIATPAMAEKTAQMRMK